MLIIHIHDEKIAQQLEQISTNNNLPIEDVLRKLLETYQKQGNPLELMNGIFDDNISDLSTSVQNTMTTWYQQKHDDESN